MKKLLSALVLIVMLAQVLPLDALATVGKSCQRTNWRRPTPLRAWAQAGWLPTMTERIMPE